MKVFFFLFVINHAEVDFPNPYEPSLVLIFERWYNQLRWKFVDTTCIYSDWKSSNYAGIILICKTVPVDKISLKIMSVRWITLSSLVFGASDNFIVANTSFITSIWSLNPNRTLFMWYLGLGVFLLHSFSFYWHWSSFIYFLSITIRDRQQSFNYSSYTVRCYPLILSTGCLYNSWLSILYLGTVISLILSDALIYWSEYYWYLTNHDSSTNISSSICCPPGSGNISLRISIQVIDNPL